MQEGVPQGEIFNFTMESKDSKFYPGIAREPNTFARPIPRSRQADRQQPPGAYTRKVSVYVRSNTCRDGRAVHRRGGWTGPGCSRRWTT